MLKDINFLIFRDFFSEFFGFFLNFFKFQINLFDFYFCASNVVASGASTRAINHERRLSLKAGVRGTILLTDESS